MPLDLDQIDHRYVDVHFPSEKRYVFGATPRRFFGALPPAYEDVVPEIPREQWPALAEKMDAEGGGLEQLVTRIFDQGQEGSCVGNASTQGNQVMQAAEVGKKNVIQLSPISLYKQIGRSPQSGSSIDDALDAMTNVGIVPLDTPENRARFQAVMPATGFYTAYPNGWKATAALFRVRERFILQTLGGLVTAVFNGHAVIVGREGHSICYVRPFYKNGVLYMMYANSWTEEWGFAAGDFKGGFGADSLRQIQESSDWAFAIRDVTTYKQPAIG